MPKAIKGCLVFTILILIAGFICLAVWFVGTLMFGLPTAREGLGQPAPDLSQTQEVALSIYLMLNLARLDEPAGDPGMVWTVEVEPGSSAQSVIDQLTTVGLLDNPVLFRAYIRYLGLDRGIETGMYDLSGTMSIRELASALQSARIDALLLTIPEGWRAEEVAAKIEASGIAASAAEVLSAEPGLPALSFELPPGRTTEGFLFPDTYEIAPTMTAEELVGLMLSNFDQRIDDDLRQGFTAQGLSLYEAVTLASIVEREAVIADERPHIASVFLNRLAIGMNLDADPTVQYAVASSRNGEWWPQLSLADLEFDSPYNTYRYPGLPPGPIASPGLDSLRAVAFPLVTNDFYFRAVCDGSGRHAFAETFEEHQQNSCP
jgi:UPF0755 protein